ncbi:MULTISPECIES: Arc family DNA-binding protein [Pandoraea]
MPQVNIRMPEGLKSWLEGEAQQNFRSLSAEIVRLLTEVRERSGERGNVA